MADKGRYNLSVNERGPSVNFFGSYDLFNYQQWVTTKNYVLEPFTITPINTTHTRGSTTTFEIDKRADELGKIDLKWERGFLTVGGGGTYGRFVDYEAPHSVEVVRFYYGNKLIHEIYGEKLLYDQLKQDNEETRTKHAHLQLGELSASDRDALAANTATLHLDLRVPWAKMRKHLKFVALPNKLRVEIHWARLLNIVQGDDPANISGGAISNPVLRCEFFHLKQMDRTAAFAAVQTKQGLAFKYLSHEYHRREPIANGATTHRLRLRNIKNDVVYLMLILRKQTDVDGGVSPGADPNSLQVISKVQVQENGTDIIQPLEFETSLSAPSYDLLELSNRVFPDGKQGDRIYIVPFCYPEKIKDSCDNCYGSRAIGKYNNCELFVTFPAALVGNHYLDVWADIHNIFLQRQGDMKRFLS